MQLYSWISAYKQAIKTCVHMRRNPVSEDTKSHEAWQWQHHAMAILLRNRRVKLKQQNAVKCWKKNLLQPTREVFVGHLFSTNT